MPSILLPVPHYPQTGKHNCLPACARMVLGYLGLSATEEELAVQLGTTPLGTTGRNLLRLQDYLLSVVYGPLTISLLKTELNQSRPVIVLVSTIFLDYWQRDTAHAVVVVGYDDDHLFLNDPAFANAPQTVTVDGILAAWGEFDFLAGVVKKK